jgi:hypothetical protein
MVCITKQNGASILSFDSIAHHSCIMVGAEMNRAERRANQVGKTKQMKMIMACPPKPNFLNVAEDIVAKSKSPFTDDDWLTAVITNELNNVWEIATRTEAERIQKLCIKQGRMDMFGRWKDKNG